MILSEREIRIPPYAGNDSLLTHLQDNVERHLHAGEVPVRFAVTRTDDEGYRCELGVLAGIDGLPVSKPESIFDLAPRKVENTNLFNVALIVPTGIGAEIGGHAGDATPVARLLASVCDTLITHPNVVNASDINELPQNGLYVEGSVISRLLMGTAGLQRVRSNRVIVIIDEHKDPRMSELTINSVSAARATLGLDCPLVIKMQPPIDTTATYSPAGTAAGRITGVERLFEVLRENQGSYDAAAIASVIKVPWDYHEKYFIEHGKMVNPWGGVEAMLTHAISMTFNVPSAHSPMLETMEIANLNVGLVDPRMSAEAVSTCFFHCVLKGLHRSPRIITDVRSMACPGVLTAADVSCLVIPDGCLGLPTLAALQQGIPVIAVRENRNMMRNDLTKLPFAHGRLFIVDNYLEAAGVIAALKAGVAVSSVRRPMTDTTVVAKNLQSSTASGARTDGIVLPEVIGPTMEPAEQR